MLSGLEISLIVLLILAFYSYFFYPIILMLIPANKLSYGSSNEKQSVSIIIAAYNEEDYISECLDSIVNCDLENIEFEVLVGADGCTDRTVDKANEFNDKIENLKVIEFERSGKNSVINSLVENSEKDILVFIDADCRFRKDTIKNALNEFKSDEIGAVICPIEVKDTNEDAGTKGEALYQKYESFIRKRESEISSCVNALGSYLIRSELFLKYSNNKVCDDLHSLLSVVSYGKRVYFQSKNFIDEVRSKDIGGEFGRRKRLVGGGLSTIFEFKKLLSPAAGWPSFFLWSHKILRWFASVFLLLSYLVSIALINTSFGFVVFSIITVLLILSLIGYVLEKNNLKNPFKIPLFFITMNIGFIEGIIQFLSKKQNAIWSRKGLE